MYATPLAPLHVHSRTRTCSYAHARIPHGFADAISRIMYEVAEDACRDGVRYLEVRFSPVLHTQLGLSLGQVMEGMLVVELSRFVVCWLEV